LAILKTLTSPSTLANGLCCDLSDGFQLRVEVLEDWLVRIAVAPVNGFEVDRTWMIAPEGDAPWEGRHRLSTGGFNCPSVDVSDKGFTSGDWRLAIESDPLRLSLERRVDGHWRTISEDRPGSAWRWSEAGHRSTHYQVTRDGEAHYGLGDKTGPLDRTGRRLRCLQSDALGYDAERSDPLYKHIPFVIASTQEASIGLLYDTMAETTFDLGAEHSNYFPRYRHVEMQECGVVLYVIAGPRVADVVPRLHALTGRPAFPPRWSLGFAFTSMHHADAEDAQEVITDFAREARRRELPISALHLGSGYTAGEDGLRYVFNWNTDRFPDRREFFAGLKKMGFRTCANIKPVLLTGHSSYQLATEQNWFVRSGEGGAAVEAFWGGEGASLDFTNPDAISFWQAGVGESVLGAGFDAVWNDNNEAELWDEDATIDGFGHALPAIQARPVHALLMTRASYEATLSTTPDERPYTISRAGPVGIARYGETWSGDNRTSWHTLKWNLRQGLSMGLSGMPLVGHDIGGFDGPPPEPELLVRWFQMMALHPRCVMNSWKPQHGNIPNLPWMHEEVFDHIKSALELRYRLLPLIYSLVWESHCWGSPIIAPTLYHFDDEECRLDADTFMLGPNLLAAPVVERGASGMNCYLPNAALGWVDFTTGEHLPGGQVANVKAPLDRLPLFVRAGAVLPLARDWLDNSPHDATVVTMAAFAGVDEGKTKGRVFFDDGIGWGYRDDKASLVEYTLDWATRQVGLSLTEAGDDRFRPVIETAIIDLAKRPAEINSGFELKTLGNDGGHS